MAKHPFVSFLETSFGKDVKKFGEDDIVRLLHAWESGYREARSEYITGHYELLQRLDTTAFWHNSWTDVQKELKGRSIR